MKRTRLHLAIVAALITCVVPAGLGKPTVASAASRRAAAPSRPAAPTRAAAPSGDAVWGVWLSATNPSEQVGVDHGNADGADARWASDQFISDMHVVNRNVTTARFILPINTFQLAANNDTRFLYRYMGFLADPRFNDKVISIGVPANYPYPHSKDAQAYSAYADAIVAIRTWTEWYEQQVIHRNDTIYWGPANEPDYVKLPDGSLDISAQRAAQYYFAWKATCAYCNVLAGELGATAPPTTSNYQGQYLAGVGFVAQLGYGQPAAVAIHSYYYGVDTGNLVTLTKSWRTAVASTPGLVRHEIWCDECGVRIDHAVDQSHPPPSLHEGPDGLKITAGDLSDNQRWIAFVEQQRAGIFFGNAGYAADGPNRIYFSHTDPQTHAFDFDAAAFVPPDRLQSYAGVYGVRVRPGYCGFIWSQNLAGENYFCPYTGGNIFPRGDFHYYPGGPGIPGTNP